MAKKNESKPDPSLVRSALRALELLECFTPARQNISLSNLARETKLAPSTTSRLVTTLVSAGYLRKTETGLYACASRLLPIALATLYGMSVYEVAGPHLVALRDETGETANLAVPGLDGRPIYSRREESRQAIRHNIWLGETVPLEGTAIGSAMRGIVTEGGYAIVLGSIEPDVAAVAAPIRDNTGQIIAAISITMPLFRADKNIVKKFGSLIVQHANQASVQLGWQKTATEDKEDSGNNVKRVYS